MNIERKEEFCKVECVTSGDGFIAGNIYAMLGWNNGVHVVREDEYGNVEDHCYMNGGIGLGEINSWNNDGTPSFNEISGRKGNEKTSDEIAGRLEDLYDENQIKTQITAFRFGEGINFLFSGTNSDMLNTAIQIVERLIIACTEDCAKEGMNPDIALKLTKDLVRKMLANMLAHVHETWQEEREAQDAMKVAEAEMNKGMNDE